MTNHKISSIQTSDGLRLHTESWLPDGAVRAAILVIHGIGEHIGRYGHVAEFLAAQGYAVYGIDHRTHGQSEGEPRVYITDFADVVADLKGYLGLIKREQPGKRVFMYGHSMGSFISLSFLLTHQDEIAGLVSSGCPITIDSTVPPIMVTLGNFLNRVTPTLPLIALSLEAVSRDPAVVAAFENDPLVHAGRVRVRMAVGGNNAIVALRPRLGEIHIPLLVLHGGDDRTTPVAGSHMLYERASSPDKTLKIYPGLYHEIHNEPEKAEVLADITNWLDTH